MPEQSRFRPFGIPPMSNALIERIFTQLMDEIARAVNIRGAQTVKVVNITTSPYTVTSDDYLVELNLGAGGVCNLPAVANNRNRVIMLRNLDNTNNVTVTPNGSDTVNGAATYTLLGAANENVLTLYGPTAGTDWGILNVWP